MAIYGTILTLLYVVVAQRGGGFMIHLQAVLYGVDIVIGTARLLSALNHALHKLFLRHLKPYHMVEFLSAFAEESLERIGLRHGGIRRE